MSKTEKPRGGDAGDGKFVITNWRPLEHHTLRGFLSLALPSGLLIHHCTLHVSGASRWVGLPAQKYQKDDGSDAYFRLIEFADIHAKRRFQSAAIEAAEPLLGGQK